jgi:hypothetical protein
MLATEFGYRAGKRAGRKLEGNDVSTEFGVIQGAVLGLLGLLLAFTYSYVTARADMRKSALWKEANAIGTAWLRAGYYEGEPGTRLQTLLREYAQSRVLPSGAVLDQAKLKSAVVESQQRLAKLWPATLETVRASAKAHGGAPTTIDPLLLAAMNDVYDSDTLRIAANRDILPGIILVMLAMVACVSLAVTGYAGGLSSRRNVILTAVLGLMIAAVTYVILDLDHPRSGFVQMSQSPITDLIQSMDSMAAPAGASGR